MVQVSNEFAAGAPVVNYVYDAMGRRIVRKSATGGGSEWRMFYYDGLSVAAEKKSTNSGGAWAWDRLYTLAPGVIGHVLAESQWSGAAWVSTFLHYDHIGNVTLSTNASGQVVDAYDQDAFGNPLAGPGDGLRLQTKELDADAGLYYFYQRWYDHNIGRFTSMDLIYPNQILLNSNQYNYVANNPIKIIDPNGLKQLTYEKCVFACRSNYAAGLVAIGMVCGGGGRILAPVCAVYYSKLEEGYKKCMQLCKKYPLKPTPCPRPFIEGTPPFIPFPDPSLVPPGPPAPDPTPNPNPTPRPDPLPTPP